MLHVPYFRPRHRVAHVTLAVPSGSNSSRARIASSASRPSTMSGGMVLVPVAFSFSIQGRTNVMWPSRFARPRRPSEPVTLRPAATAARRYLHGVPKADPNGQLVGNLLRGHEGDPKAPDEIERTDPAQRDDWTGVDDQRFRCRGQAQPRRPRPRGAGCSSRCQCAASRPKIPRDPCRTIRRPCHTIADPKIRPH